MLKKYIIHFPHFSPLQLLLYRFNFYSISDRIKAEVFILPHHLDLTQSPFGSKMHCRDKEYYNGQQKRISGYEKDSVGSTKCKLI